MLLVYLFGDVVFCLFEGTGAAGLISLSMFLLACAGAALATIAVRTHFLAHGVPHTGGVWRKRLPIPWRNARSWGFFFLLAWTAAHPAFLLPDVKAFELGLYVNAVLLFVCSLAALRRTKRGEDGRAG